MAPKYDSGISEQSPAHIRSLAWDDYRTRRDIVALPFCHFTISIKRSRITPPLPPPITVGDHIKLARTNKKLLQREVASIIGVGTATIESWEQNRKKPLLKLLPKIFDFIGYVPDQYKDNPRLQNPIFQYRAKHGLGVKAMAKLIGVHKCTIYSWETGKIPIAKNYWLKIKKSFLT